MMVSGSDKNPPPEGRYEPDFGWGGCLFVLLIVMLVALIGFGWMLV